MGGVNLTLHGKALTGLPTRKAEALLIYLVCHERPFPREQLAELLWDDRPQEQSLANLRSILSGMRRKLKPYLTITRQSVAFNHDSEHWLDTAIFRQGIEAGQPDWRRSGGTSAGSYLQSGKTEPAGPAKEQAAAARLHALEQALELYRGDFLSGFHLRESRGFEEWATLERERYRRQAVLGLRQLAQHYLRQGQFFLAVRVARRLVQLEELSEEAHRLLMLALARNGELSAALAQYRTCRQILAAELEVAPAAETAALHERIRAAFSAPRHNLPPQPTPFVGRVAELQAVQARLSHPDCRLMTILGAGGMGKTRLALAAATAMTETGLFLNGIRFVSAAGITTPRLLPAALADALNLTFQGTEPPAAQLAAHLRNQELLLLLDNMEHLLESEEAADSIELLAQILNRAPQVTMIVTSRQRLQLREEWIFDLSGLAYPPIGTDAGTAVQYSAVQLFLQTARRIQRHFHATGAESAAIVDICNLLEGMPLGIELAAASVRQFAPSETARRLRENVDFLTTKLHNVPARHRSIRAVFDHSWQLLAPEARTVLARLAIFSGSFSAAAAAAVCDAETAVLDTLVSRSLLRRHNSHYDLHPLLQQYAASKLEEHQAQVEDARSRHTGYYLDLLAKLDQVEYGEQRQHLRLALPDIRAAWEESARRQDAAALAKAAPPLHRFFSVSSRFVEGIDAFQFAIDLLQSEQQVSAERALALCELFGRQARMHIHVGQLAAAREALAAARTYLPQVTEPGPHASIVGNVAITHFYAGDFEEATELACQSLELSRAQDDRDGIAFALGFLGSCAKAQGSYTEAKDYFAQSRAVYKELGDDLGVAMALNNLGNVAQAMGEYAQAQEYYLTCSRLFQEHDHLHGAATTLSNAGRLALKQEDFDRARQLLHESVTLKRKLKDERGTAVALVGLGGVSIAVRDFPQAKRELYEALQSAHNSGDVKLVLETIAALGRLAYAQKEVIPAARLHAFVLAHRATSQEVREPAAAVQTEIPGPIWQAATLWAAQQTVDDLVAALLDEESGSEIENP